MGPRGWAWCAHRRACMRVRSSCSWLYYARPFVQHMRACARASRGRGVQEDELVAYQVAFDLVENEMQSFLHQVQQDLDKLIPPPAAPAAAAPSDGGGTFAAPAAGGDAMDTDAPAPAAAVAAPAAPESVETAALRAKLSRTKDILSGKTPIGLYMDFLYRNNHADLVVLKGIKVKLCAARPAVRAAAISMRGAGPLAFSSPFAFAPICTQRTCFAHLLRTAPSVGAGGHASAFSAPWHIHPAP
eukprot:237396-Chlamydomonas_euryale.AAC.5